VWRCVGWMPAWFRIAVMGTYPREGRENRHTQHVQGTVAVKRVLSLTRDDKSPGRQYPASILTDIKVTQTGCTYQHASLLNVFAWDDVTRCGHHTAGGLEDTNRYPSSAWGASSEHVWKREDQRGYSDEPQ
jgi:hypothetical protein